MSTAPPPEFWESYAYTRDYHRYWIVYREVKNPAFTPLDGEILDLKKGVPHAVNRAARVYRDVLKEWKLDSNSILGIVPGHDKSSTNAQEPLGRIATWLGGKLAPLVAQPDILLRHTMITKLARGGDRSVEIHLGSLALPNPALANGKTVIILDDVATSGNSITACRRLLKNAGAKRVGALVLGKTI